MQPTIECHVKIPGAAPQLSSNLNGVIEKLGGKTVDLDGRQLHEVPGVVAESFGKGNDLYFIAYGRRGPVKEFVRGLRTTYEGVKTSIDDTLLSRQYVSAQV